MQSTKRWALSAWPCRMRNEALSLFDRWALAPGWLSDLQCDFCRSLPASDSCRSSGMTFYGLTLPGRHLQGSGSHAFVGTGLPAVVRMRWCTFAATHRQQAGSSCRSQIAENPRIEQCLRRAQRVATRFSPSKRGHCKKKLRLDVLISRLRSKLSPFMGEFNPIKSVRGRGYQLCMPLAIE
jgi:hypothetical protein